MKKLFIGRGIFTSIGYYRLGASAPRFRIRDYYFIRRIPFIFQEAAPLVVENPIFMHPF